MKKASGRSSAGLRAEYKRSDFRSLVRGKYADRIANATNVVVLLRGRKRAARRTGRATRTRRERRAG